MSKRSGIGDEGPVDAFGLPVRMPAALLRAPSRKVAASSRTYFDVPRGSLATARTIMLDWNISSRIEKIHRRQARLQPLNLASTEIERLRHLAMGMQRGAVIMGAFAAAEPETRRTPGAHVVDRYNSRTDIASVYLEQVPDYLLHLLNGGQSGGLVIESEPDDVPYTPDPFRAWFMISYATLLMAAKLYRDKSISRRVRVERFVRCLQSDLQLSPSHEAWVGFKLLAGRGDQPAKAARLLKLGRPHGIADAIWGATWDLMYTRIPNLMEAPPLRSIWPLPMCFVTDDAALVDAFDGSDSPFLVTNAKGATFGGVHVDITLLHDDVHSIVRSHLEREKVRVLTESPGLIGISIVRATRLAKALELHFE
jgi:hypothetical protein